MLRSIIPKEIAFFYSFEEICVLVVKSVEKLGAMIKTDRPFDARASEIKQIEREVDQKVSQIVEELHQTFVTRFDRRDIFNLTTGLGNILDTIETVSSRLKRYAPKQGVKEAQELTRVLIQSVKAVAEMVGLLRNLKKQSKPILELAVKVNRFEYDAGQCCQNAIFRLFQEENEAKELIKWKDILEHIEAATERCKDVSDIIEGIVLENT